MLSILIPTYNYNVLPLVSELKKQADSLNIEYEILVQDDASDSDLNNHNQKINLLEFCSFKSNSENLGRGKNINSLSEQAAYSWFLILDCDMFPSSADFMKKYITHINEGGNNVIYGGIIYENKRPQPEFLLRWEYGKKREALSVEKRKNNPYNTLLTSNLLVSKQVFTANPFPKEITDYGYEDLVWTKHLKDLLITVLHVENPAYHLGIEKSEVYLKKVQKSIENLKIISNLNLVSPTDSKLLYIYRMISKVGLQYLLKPVFGLLKEKIEKNLLSLKPSLFLFDIYKLVYFCKINT